MYRTSMDTRGQIFGFILLIGVKSSSRAFRYSLDGILCISTRCCHHSSVRLHHVRRYAISLLTIIVLLLLRQWVLGMDRMLTSLIGVMIGYVKV